MKKYIFVVFLLICKISFCQYIIPNASQQPKWCFPLFIEEGSGKKDTVYLAYDPNAHPLFGYGELDTLFGEKPLTLDTTKFNSYLEHPHSLYYSIYDTLYKVKAEVSSDFYFPCITVINGVFPVKIKWDLHQFYSDSLPFPSKYPLPNGQGNLGLLFPIIPVNSDCESQFPILVSDTGNYYNCMVKDSIIVKSYSGNNQFTKFKFYFSSPSDFHIKKSSPFFSVKITSKYTLFLAFLTLSCYIYPVFYEP